MTDPTPNGQAGDLICPLATCFGCPDPGRCDALRRGDQPAPSQRDPELAAALNEQRRQSYNAETLRTRPAPSSDEAWRCVKPGDGDCGPLDMPNPDHERCGPAPSSVGQGRPEALDPREEIACGQVSPAPSSDTPADEAETPCPWCPHPLESHRKVSKGAGCIFHDCGCLMDSERIMQNDPPQHTPAPSSPVPEASGRPKWEPLTLREAAIEAILIREQDTAFSTVARIIAALPAPSSSPAGDRGLDVTALPEWEALRAAVERWRDAPWRPDVEVAARALLAAAGRGEPTDA